MNTTFKVILENDVNNIACKYLKYCDYVNGEYSMTGRGKRKDREEYEPKKKNARKRLNTLLELNYPEFIGRFEFVAYFMKKEHTYVAVTRIGCEKPTS